MASEFSIDDLLAAIREKYPNLQQKDTTKIRNLIKENFSTFKEFEDIIQFDPKLLFAIYQQVKSEIEDKGGSN